MKTIELPISTYYQKIIDLVIELYDDEFQSAVSGHCMKITGFGSHELDYLWSLITTKYRHIDTFIIDDEINSKKHISATKLIELRNKQENPLLVLIPSNSRTAAEDSYGNATFKEISLEGLEYKLKDELINGLEKPYKKTIKEIFSYLSSEGISSGNIISYLIALEEAGYSNKNIGDFIFHLGLIPDSILIDEIDKMRSRLNFNLTSIRLISSFGKPLYDRIYDLPLEPNTLQKEVVSFLKNEKRLKKKVHLCDKIHSNYPQLNFSNWQIPDLNYDGLQLEVESISPGDRKTQFKKEEDTWILRVIDGKTSKLKVRVRTSPPPKDVAELTHFRVILMAVDGKSGEPIQDLRIVKKTNSPRPYRDITFNIEPNLIEEGSYFIKILAEDDNEMVLNKNDKFKNPAIQKEWEDNECSPDFKKTLEYKLSCDSDDFLIYIEEDNIEEDIKEIKKAKIKNVLQAYFQYRITQFRQDEELKTPVPTEGSNIWLSDSKRRHSSTFYINYTSKHNYQINLSTKLRYIENSFLENKDKLGYIIADLNSNTTSIDFKNLRFIPSELTSLIPNEILELRQELYDGIQGSNEQNNGVFETADIFNLIETIRKYLEGYEKWTSALKQKVSNPELENKEKGNLQKLLTELQFLDLAKIRTKLPNGNSINALLISPLHPLRLAWFTQLFEVFSNWEQKTCEFDKYKESWVKNLDALFEGQLSPENNPIVFVDPSDYKSFHYSGELAYGWGLYLNPSIENTGNGMTSVTRQLQHYFRLLFNITKDNYVETDISLSLIIKQIKNYLIQHPYTDKLIINLVNAGVADVFADALVELEKDPALRKLKYEIRIFKGEDKIIEHGEALRKLINPEFNVTEEAEAFSQPSKNRLFPKLRFSINHISDYLQSPGKYVAHLSFLVSPFPVQIELVKAKSENQNFYLNALITDATVNVEEEGNSLKWSRFIQGSNWTKKYGTTGNIGIQLFNNIQTFTSSVLASKFTEAIPATQLSLNDRDTVLLAHLHDYSDWVITFDKHLGSQVFDQPSKEGRIPFLLDYIPGEELSGVSSFLTTKPTSEVLGLLGPHFEEFNLDVYDGEDRKKIKTLLEDLRAISSSLILQLNSTKNKAFEVIGAAFTKRVLEKKGFLRESFLIPIDLHQNLFENLPSDSRSRADTLLVSMDIEKKEISVSVIEIKCRTSLGQAEKGELKVKMVDQIENTILALQYHFDSEYHLSFDRLDREIKNKELKSLLSFYIERAYRYEYLEERYFTNYNVFLQRLDDGFSFKFHQLGLIFNFSAPQRHKKEVINNDLTFFTFGAKLIDDILDPNADLKTTRLEGFEEELSEAIGINNALKPLIEQLKQQEEEQKVKEEEKKETENIQQLGKIEVVDQEIDMVDSESEEEYGEVLKADSDNKESTHITPQYDILIGKTSDSPQFGVLGTSIHGKKIAIDLGATNTISLFGVQGGGKSYTIGTVSEMVLKQFSNINELPSPLAGAIFHYSESMDYAPEFTSMIYPNDKEGELQKLKDQYGANPDKIEDVIILTPKDKVQERQAEYPSIKVVPIAFNSKELNVQDWTFLLGAIGNDSTYIKQLKAIMKEHRRNITLGAISRSVEESDLLSSSQKALARQKLSFAREYIDDNFTLKDLLKPGRLLIVDLRDEFIVKDEALGLFVIMLKLHLLL